MPFFVINKLSNRRVDLKLKGLVNYARYCTSDSANMYHELFLWPLYSQNDENCWGEEKRSEKSAVTGA